ncbi:MAG: S8 family serine peptidase [Bacteroidales bacterium]|nr:S8 family serine peptidase [Bacteroidales bacterium]
MKRTYTLFAACALSLFAACTKQEVKPEAPAGAKTEDTQALSGIIEGELVVEFSEQMTAAVEQDEAGCTKAPRLRDALAALGAVRLERVFPEAGEWEERHRAAGLHRWYRVHYEPGKAQATKASRDLSALEGVLSAEPARRIRTAAIFNDPYLSRQWHYSNSGGTAQYTAGADCNVVPVWERYTGGRSDVIVSVEDEGVDLTHVDLAQNCLPAEPGGSRCFIDGNTGYRIVGGNHGTHVAGTIAAVNNNGTGVCGIAGGLDGKGGVKIMSCEIMREISSRETLQGDSEDAMVWAADNGAVISQNSWSYVYETEAQASKGGPGPMKAAIDYFIQYAGTDKAGNQTGPMKGGVVFFSAGNESWRYSWPGGYAGDKAKGTYGKCLAVGAFNSLGRRAYYSNYGDWVDIAAPGGDYKVGPEVYSTIAGNKYDMMQGTSMACPHVSGVAALLVSWFGGPGFTNDMLVERLLGGADHSFPSAYQIGPKLDALGAFTYGKNTAPAPVSSYEKTVLSNSVSVSFPVTPDEDGLPGYGYMLCAAGTKGELEALDPHNVPASIRAVSQETQDRQVGDDMQLSLQDLAFDTTYYISVFGFDYNRNFSDAAPIQQIRTGGNHPPVIETDYTGDFTVKPAETLQVVFTVRDPDGHGVSLKLESANPAFSLTVRQAEAGTFLFTVRGSATVAGTYPVALSATDAYGMGARKEFTVTIRENQPPVCIKELEDVILPAIGAKRTLKLSDYFEDPDGDVLTCTIATGLKQIVHMTHNEGDLLLSAIGYGQTSVTVTVADALGKSASSTFRALVRDSSRPVDLYPNPVSDILYIRPASGGAMTVSVTSRTGATVYEKSGDCSPFEPLEIDVKAWSGGMYYVSVTNADVSAVYPIAKL